MSNVVKFTTDADARDLMSQAKFFEGYARWDDNKNRYETWDEAVERVMNMHKIYYADRMTDELKDLIDQAEESYKKQYVLGAQRALQFGGEQLLKHQMRLFNCTSTYADRVEYFGELFYVLLCGAGAGVSVQKHHVARLPAIKSRKGQSKVHVIEDSIEGWATAADVLMSSFFENGGVHPEYQGRKVYFDTNKIRPKGAMISGGFKAPGPEPLRKALDKIERLLQEAVEAEQTHLSTIQVYDISMHLADAVLAGGVRRSATIFLFSFDDEDMMNAKTGNWYQQNPQRARSNNSAVLVRSEVTREQFAKLMKSTREFGEPGFLFVESTEHATNPCVTADTMVLTDQGKLPVRELIGTKFNAIVNGKSYKTTGFWKTGTKPVYLLTTSDGYSVRATSNHKILTTNGWKELKDITENDSVVLNHNTDVMFGDDADFEKGWLVGSFHGDGTISGKSAKLIYWNEEIRNSSEYARSMLSKHFYTYKTFNASINEKYDGKNSSIAFESAALYRYCQEIGAIVDGRKNNLENIESMSNSFKLGYLAGMIDSDGSWQGSVNGSLSLRVWQKSLKRLEQMQRFLIDLGIKSVIYKDRNKSRSNINSQLPGIKNLDPGEMNELSISGSSLVDLLKIIKLQNKKYLGLYDEVKKYKKGPYQSKFHSKVKSITLNGFEDVYDVTVDEVHCFDANGIIVHNCVEIGMFPQYEGITGWQGCVEYNTKLLTKNGIVKIGEAAEKGQEIEIWNGKNWSKVKPIQTGENRKLYRIQLNDGSVLEATENHKFLVKTKPWNEEFTEVELKDLIKILPTAKYGVKIPRANIVWDGNGIKNPHAYDLGYILGDATCKDKRRPFAEIYEKEFEVMNFLNGFSGKIYENKNRVKFTRFYWPEVNIDFCHNLKYNEGLPNEVFSWNRESLKEFIAGWIDSDGSVSNYGFRIYGEESKIRDLQLLLTKMDIKSSVCLCSPKGTKTSIGTRSRDLYYINVVESKDLYGKLKTVKSKTIRRNEQLIKTIEEVPGLHNSYCFEESELHQGLFGNFLTKQCNLTEINGAKAINKEEFFKAITAAAILGTLQAGYTNFKFVSETTRKIFEREALLGVSITGWMNNPQILLNEEILKEGAKLVKSVNKKVAELIGINPAARTTCVKPAGNACTTFDTKIKTEHGAMSLKEIFDYCTDNNINVDVDNIGDDTSFQVLKDLRVFDENNDLQDITGLYVNGMARLYEIEFEDGSVYKFTDHHKLKTTNGWKMVKDLSEDDEIISFN